MTAAKSIAVPMQPGRGRTPGSWGADPEAVESRSAPAPTHSWGKRDARRVPSSNSWAWLQAAEEAEHATQCAHGEGCEACGSEQAAEADRTASLITWRRRILQRTVSRSGYEYEEASPKRRVNMEGARFKNARLPERDERIEAILEGLLATSWPPPLMPHRTVSCPDKMYTMAAEGDESEEGTFEDVLEVHSDADVDDLYEVQDDMTVGERPEAADTLAPLNIIMRRKLARNSSRKLARISRSTAPAGYGSSAPGYGSGYSSSSYGSYKTGGYVDGYTSETYGAASPLPINRDLVRDVGAQAHRTWVKALNSVTHLLGGPQFAVARR